MRHPDFAPLCTRMFEPSFDMLEEKATSDHDEILDGTVSETRYRAVFEHCTDAMLLTALDSEGGTERVVGHGSRFNE